MARLTLANLLTKINAFLADNTGRAISPAKVRELQTDIKDSFTHLDDFESHLNDDGNPHSVTKSQVGLSNVDNTSDADKPISIATQLSLDDKLEASDIADRQKIATGALNGTSIRFDQTAVYGTYVSPENGNLTYSNSGAKIGTRIVIIHNAASEPSYGTEFKKLKSSQPYQGSTVNYITCTLVSTNRIIFSIDQEL